MKDIITLRSHPRGTLPFYKYAPQCERMIPILQSDYHTPTTPVLQLFLTIQSAEAQIETIIPESEVLTAVLTMSTIFWGITRCSLLKVSTDVSEKHIACIFRAE
jgi:hypothetical protein